MVETVVQERTQDYSKWRISRGVVMKILTYLPASQLFKGNVIQLCKKVYQEEFLFRELAFLHLGIVEDYE